MNVLLLHLDGSQPNRALMRIAAHHAALGDLVTLRRTDTVSRVPARFGDDFQRVYASAIFDRSQPLVDAVQKQWPGAVIGGSGADPDMKLECIGIPTEGALDYSGYPAYRHSIGFTQRGCRLNCSFCLVPRREGKVRAVSTVAEIWRGDPWPKNLLLLDNDFGGHPGWRDVVRDIHAGGFRVSFNQGMNARLFNEEQAEALASLPYYDGDFKTRRFYTAWDSKGSETILFRGLEWLCKYGVKPDHLMVYMLIGFWPGETHEDRDYRRRKLREFGARPYPMPYRRTPELLGFQRWVVPAYDKRVSWDEWRKAKYEPRNLNRNREAMTLLR